jgi:hypothetical protein
VRMDVDEHALQPIPAPGGLYSDERAVRSANRDTMNPETSAIAKASKESAANRSQDTPAKRKRPRAREPA